MGDPPEEELEDEDELEPNIEFSELASDEAVLLDGALGGAGGAIPAVLAWPPPGRPVDPDENHGGKKKMASTRIVAIPGDESSMPIGVSSAWMRNCGWPV